MSGSSVGERATVGVATRVIPVGGMHCAACASKVEAAARRVAGVRSASVSFATAKLRVELALTDELGQASQAGSGRESGPGIVGSELGRGPELGQASQAASQARLIEQLAREVGRAGFALDLSRDPAARAAAELSRQQGLSRRVVICSVLAAPLVAIAMSHGSIPWLAGRVGLVMLARGSSSGLPVQSSFGVDGRSTPRRSTACALVPPT